MFCFRPKEPGLVMLWTPPFESPSSTRRTLCFASPLPEDSKHPVWLHHPEAKSLFPWPVSVRWSVVAVRGRAGRAPYLWPPAESQSFDGVSDVRAVR
ncbi:hypothetical protein COCON_G00221080 [Conger conger]|uniref:Uncharacterized protein n=1 Tax=Conger conger TaxID=82655 RepID=A0A9Q1HND1_CONCO|nr:hypothetical protein COCON_G00221080 [Conger conger]